MISICIPVYNYCVYPLVSALRNQAHALGVEVELVCIDDCSSEEYRLKNSSLKEIATYVQLEENVGRARIRNLFVTHTKGEYLLFLDNDSLVGEGFLKAYLELLDSHPSVVVGGRIYDRETDSPERHLRYLYGTRVESRGAKHRRRHPYRSFMTNNFLIRREILEEIGFDDSLSRYGHEDTLFGYRLQQKGIPILHIDNPVVNGEVETNEVFLAKSMEAVENLSLLYDRMRGDKDFCRSVRLLSVYEHLRAMHLLNPVLRCCRRRKAHMEQRLKEGRRVTVAEFNLYKLGQFIATQNN